MSFKRILIPIDGGEVSRHAAERALELAKALGAEVATVFVIEPPVVAGGNLGFPPPEMMELSSHEDRQIVEGLRRDIALPAEAPHFRRVGGVADTINEVAAEWAADLIMIGSHGRKGLGRLLLGSVAEAVVRHAPCPVLIVRGAG